jgi:hypothetical protein
MILIISDSVINSRNLLVFIDFLTNEDLMGCRVLRINAFDSLEEVVRCSMARNIRKS